MSVAATATQETFELLLGFPGRELLRVDEVAGRLRLSRDMICEMVETGELGAHRRTRDKTQDVQRTALLITRASVVLWLMKSASYSPQDLLDSMMDVARKLSAGERQTLIRRLSAMK